MISKEQIEKNKARFLELVNSINREGMKKDLLIRQLTESDFFYAPASMNHHGCYSGGLCEHSLNVYDNLSKLVADFYDEEAYYESVKIVALFHDFSNMNYFVHDVKNKKVYSDHGQKQDSQGKYDWVQVDGYSKRDYKSRFMIGNHEANSAYMTDSFIPLTQEEYCAILNHHGGMDSAPLTSNICELWGKYPLSLLLHQADCIASFMQESDE